MSEFKPRCPACYSDEWDAVGETDGFTDCLCCDCGLVFPYVRILMLRRLEPVEPPRTPFRVQIEMEEQRWYQSRTCGLALNIFRVPWMPGCPFPGEESYEP